MKEFISLITFVGFCGLLGCSKGSDTFAGILDSPSGGTGTASIAVTSFSPPTAQVVVKDTNTQSFLVSATGQGTLLYQWTLDGVTVGSDSPNFSLDATLYSPSVKTLKLTIHDEVGSTTQEWSVKVNGSPVITNAVPSPTSAYLRRGSLLNYSLNLTDPNSDTLTYVWKLDGQENVLTSTTNNTDWTPTTTDVGTHVISVDIYDGPISETGTYKVTRSWTTYVNHFASACNDMENQTQTNKSCVFVGIAGIGDGLNPQTSASSFYIRPASLAKTSAQDLFIGDDVNHVVWFYNLHSSPSISVLGVTVPVNTMKVVAGVGMASTGNSASSKALRNFLNSPHGLAWDGSNLYISDTSNNRVLKVDANGDRSNVLTVGCTSPRGLTLVGTDLFIACYSSNTIRKVDLTNLASTIFAGTGAAGNPSNTNESSFTDATNGQLNGPYGITSDSSGSIYVGEYTGCRIRFYNRSGAPQTFYGSYLVNNNMQRILVGAAGAPNCTPATGEAINLTASVDGHVGNVRLMTINSTGELLFGHDRDVIAAVNFSSGATTIMGVSINPYEVRSVMGSGTAGYLGEGQTSLTTRFNNPFAVVEDSTSGDYFIADNGNARLRKIKSADSKSELVAGNGSQRAQTNAGQGLLEVGLEKMNSVRGLATDTVSGEVFISDSGNNRIRVVNRYGQITQAVGTGSSGLGAEEDEYPSNITMNQPRGLVLTHKTTTFGGNLVWADSANHRIRIYNRSSVDDVLFGVSVGAGKIATIGGDGTSGNAVTGSALQPAFNTPSGVAFDGTDLYVADTNNHCIKKIDATGNLSAVAGTCGSSGNVNGPVGIGKMSSPEGIDYYVNGAHRGIVIAARGNTRIKFLRLAGGALLFGGSISIGDTNSIGCGGTFHTEGINANLAICSGVYDVAAVGSKVCFINYSYHNARCIQSTGEVSTVLGPPQGVDDVTNLYFPGGSFAQIDFDLLSPNYTSQNGVTAAYTPSPVAAPDLTEGFGQVAFPMTIRPIDDSTLVVGEYNLGLIRKVKLP